MGYIEFWKECVGSIGIYGVQERVYWRKGHMRLDPNLIQK
jgi:hypothetical protein